MTLTDYINAHAGETAWIFGKGPSLSDFDFNQAGPLRCAINDVIQAVPEVCYAFANDGVGKWMDLYDAGCTLFQPDKALQEFDSRGKVACEVVTFPDDYETERIFLPVERHAECLAVLPGTLGTALQILRIMGVRHVVAVGIDGGGKHAGCAQWRTRLRLDHHKDYNRIRDAAIDYSALMGIKLEFHNPPENMTAQGKVYVKILRNCFAAAQPYHKGEIVQLTPGLARELIGCDAAIPFTPPAKPVPAVETATAPIEAKETATVKTTKRRGRPNKH